MILLRGLLESKEFMPKNMETTEQKPLTKHIQTAVTALEKQIEKYNNQARKLKKKAYDAEMEAEEVFKAIATLTDQISKLKGE